MIRADVARRTQQRLHLEQTRHRGLRRNRIWRVLQHFIRNHFRSLFKHMNQSQRERTALSRMWDIIHLWYIIHKCYLGINWRGIFEFIYFLKGSYDAISSFLSVWSVTSWLCIDKICKVAKTKSQTKEIFFIKLRLVHVLLKRLIQTRPTCLRHGVGRFA